MDVASFLIESEMVLLFDENSCHVCGSLLFEMSDRDALISCDDASSIVRVAWSIGSCALIPFSLITAGTLANSGDKAY